MIELKKDFTVQIGDNIGIKSGVIHRKSIVGLTLCSDSDYFNTFMNN